MASAASASSPPVERSFIMVKPDGIQRGLVGRIIARFESKGFQLVALRQSSPSREHLQQHYADLAAKAFFPDLIEYMTSGPVVAMVWQGDGVVAEGRKMLGATKPSESEMGTIRGDYCVDIGRNVCHGSDSAASAQCEMALWFPDGVAEWRAHSAAWVVEPSAGAEAGAEEGDDAAAKKRAKKQRQKERKRQQKALAAEGAAGGSAAAGAANDGDGGGGGDDGAVGGGDDETEGGGEAKKKKKKKKKKAKKKAKSEGDEAFTTWCDEVLTRRAPVEDPLTPSASFNGFRFTGALRPARVTPQQKWPDHIPAPDYATHPAGAAESEEAAKQTAGADVDVREGADLEQMRETCKLGREVLDIAGRFLRAGVTGDEVDQIVAAACLERNCYPSPLNYYRFPKTVCVSPNEVICHGIPDCRPIEDGDIVNLDITVYYKGFHADLNETFLIGKVDADGVRVVRTAYDCLVAAFNLITPGALYRDLGPAIARVAAQNKCSVVKTYCGHGIGTLFHTSPNVPHYKKNKAKGIMRPGHIFTVEPMINLGGSSGDRTWPDDWTAVTTDGQRSAQFEHTFLVTETGCEILTARPGTKKDALEWSLEAIQR